MIVSAKEVTTRKPHVCWGCGLKYPPGTRMGAVTAVYDAIETTYWCPVCQEYWDRHEYGDEVMFGGLRRGDPEGWEAIRQELEQKGETTQ